MYTLVVGFHHQLGPQVRFRSATFPFRDVVSNAYRAYVAITWRSVLFRQVDYAVPALPAGPHVKTFNASPYRLPEEWKFMPFLALPGNHRTPPFVASAVLPTSPLSQLSSSVVVVVVVARCNSGVCWFCCRRRAPVGGGLHVLHSAADAGPGGGRPCAGLRRRLLSPSGGGGASRLKVQPGSADSVWCVQKLANKTTDVTRNTVQKAIVVLSTAVPSSARVCLSYLR